MSEVATKAATNADSFLDDFLGIPRDQRSTEAAGYDGSDFSSIAQKIWQNKIRSESAFFNVNVHKSRRVNNFQIENAKTCPSWNSDRAIRGGRRGHRRAAARGPPAGAVAGPELS